MRYTHPTIADVIAQAETLRMDINDIELNDDQALNDGLTAALDEAMSHVNAVVRMLYRAKLLNKEVVS